MYGTVYEYCEAQLGFSENISSLIFLALWVFGVGWDWIF